VRCLVDAAGYARLGEGSGHLRRNQSRNVTTFVERVPGISYTPHLITTRLPAVRGSSSLLTNDLAAAQPDDLPETAHLGYVISSPMRVVMPGAALFTAIVARIPKPPLRHYRGRPKALYG
jgi:hypothetical protein